MSHVDTSMTTLHEKSLKVIEKTPNLEDLYLEFCNFVWPHLYTIGKVFMLAKTFQKTPKSENVQKYPKKEYFDVYASFLKETHIRTWLDIYNTHVHLKYVTFYIATCVYLLVYVTIVSATRKRLLKMSKKYVFWNSGSLGSYATNSFSCNYFVFDPNSSLSI